MAKPKPHETPEDLIASGRLVEVPTPGRVFLDQEDDGDPVGYTTDGRWVDKFLHVDLTRNPPVAPLQRNLGDKIRHRMRSLGRGVLELFDSPIFQAFALHRGLDVSRARGLVEALSEDDPDEQATALASFFGAERLEALLDDLKKARADGTVDEQEMADIYLRAVGEVPR